MLCRCDGIGRRSGLKIHRWRHRAGSSPATGTSGKLPLPSRTPHFVGCVFFCACAGTGIYFVTWTHVGTSYARSDFLWNKKSVTRFTVPPFPQKITLCLRCSFASALTTLRLASNFLRVSTTVICRYLFLVQTHAEKPVENCFSAVRHYASEIST